MLKVISAVLAGALLAATPGLLQARVGRLEEQQAALSARMSSLADTCVQESRVQTLELRLEKLDSELGLDSLIREMKSTSIPGRVKSLEERLSTLERDTAMSRSAFPSMQSKVQSMDQCLFFRKICPYP